MVVWRLATAEPTQIATTTGGSYMKKALVIAGILLCGACIAMLGCAKTKPLPPLLSGEQLADVYGRTWNGKHFTELSQKHHEIDVQVVQGLQRAHHVHARVWHRYDAETDSIPKGLVRILYRNYWVYLTVIIDNTLIYRDVSVSQGASDEEAPLLSPLDAEKWEDPEMLDIPLTR